MVVLHVKKGSEDQFLFECSVQDSVPDVTTQLVKIYNGRLKITRMCAEIEELADHGAALPPNMVGLTDEQIEELHLVDPACETHIPSGGYEPCKDEIGKRNGFAPRAEMAKLLKDTCIDALASVHKNRLRENKTLTYDDVKDAFLKLKGAVTIVYPMGLPCHDSLYTELLSLEAADLDACNGAYRDVLDQDRTTLWWAGKELKRDKCLKDFIGGNEKTKVVVKLAVMGAGAPGREPVFSDEVQKKLMLDAFKRRQELEKLAEDDDHTYLNSSWADNQLLKRSFQGIRDIKFAP